MILYEKLSVPYEKVKSKDYVPIKCDYCGIELEKQKQKIQNQNKIIAKDCCKSCCKKKQAEISMAKYGVANPFQRKDVKEKIKRSNIAKYGVEHAQQSSEIRAKSRATCLKNHGTEHALQNKAILQKAQATSLERHGSCFPIQLDQFKSKVRDTNLERYGVENFLSSEEVKEQIKNTNLERYGTEYAASSEEVQEKTKSTMLERYGVDNAFKSEEIKEKIKSTNVKRYGVEHPSKSREVREKTKKTNLEKYGHETPSKNPEVRQKTANTNLERYGAECNLSLPETKERIRKTNLERYGVECTLKSPEVQEKIRQTNIEKYGHEHTFSCDEIREKALKTKIARYGKPYPTWKYGKTQEEIKSWLASLGFNFISDHTVLEGKELDCYDQDQNLAIEYCGLYWHNENSPQPRTRSYHHDKWKKCRDKGIRLLTIFDDEWNSKKEVCRSMILSKLGVFGRRIHARKCETKEITKDEMKGFCDLHHLQGGNRLSEVCFGLFHGEELVAVVDMGRHHRKKDLKTAVLTRLCFKAGLQVVGGSGKLFKACVDWCRENGVEKIVSWSDNRYSDGTVYEKMGFVKADDLPPDYYYVNMKNPKKRLSKQSQSKKKAQCPPDMTELEWANSRGLSRIWDCGKTRWEFIRIEDRAFSKDAAPTHRKCMCNRLPLM